jgi:hypothetical protein
MQPLPAQDLRTNVASWAIPISRLPAVAYCLPHLAPTESFDPTFAGQHLHTTYFDTQKLLLRKARTTQDRYLTLRLRCYGDEVYALSAKTKDQKWRQEITRDDADAILAQPSMLLAGLPADLAARYQEIAGDRPLVQAVCIHCHRYAVESTQDRFTLDVGVRTDTGKELPFAVLEYKSTDPGATAPGSLLGLAIRPLKLSKFLWASTP